jgi:aspartyl-tRNA(Asn)/glutamyl-tRNA(Gln) amidotransferase subunit B
MVIGLEVHVQLKTNSKIFCSCPTTFGAEPRTPRFVRCVAGIPACCPVLNRQAVDGLVRAALALGCRHQQRSVFARKQYFYPDLPKNYQISQHDLPLAVNGHLDILQKSGGKKTVRIQRIHLEEDAGKLLHAVGSRALDYSLVDLNRTGVPLMEIVSEPDIRSPKKPAIIWTPFEPCSVMWGCPSATWKKGPCGATPTCPFGPWARTTLGTRAEVKNMNSMRSVRDAVTHEIARQTRWWKAGGGWCRKPGCGAKTGTTHSMRSKEEAHDYRYFPDPDLVPVELSADCGNPAAIVPELPEARRCALRKRFGPVGLRRGGFDGGKNVGGLFCLGSGRFEERSPDGTRPNPSATG